MRLSFDRVVPHSAAQMLDLVADVESYPDFVPHCTRMEVTRSAEAPDTRFDARMHISFGPVAQAYTSRIVVDREAMTLKAKALDGPFSHLDSIWRFIERPEGTEARFDIDFRIGNPLLRSVAEPAFAAKQREIIGAFVTEAKRRYG